MTDAFDRAVLRGELDRHVAHLHKERDGLMIHATVYVAVNALLFVIWLVTWTGFPWFLFPLMGWGVGLASHTAVYRIRVAQQRRIEAQIQLPRV
jgi:hypothetical protein